MSEWEKLYRETEAAYDKLTKSLEECKRENEEHKAERERWNHYAKNWPMIDKLIEENQKLRELVREAINQSNVNIQVNPHKNVFGETVRHEITLWFKQEWLEKAKQLTERGE